MENFDVIIHGGAVTGSVLALALSSATNHQIRIAIIEKNVPNYAEQGGFDARSIALAYGSLQKMAQIRPLAGGDLGSLIEPISTAIRQIHVSDQGHFGKTTLNADELNLDKLGAVVELATLGEKLAALLAQQSNIRLFCPDSVQQIEHHERECHLTLQSGQRLAGKLLVAADGIQSSLAKQCGVETVQIKDYQQSAIIANVKLSEAHQGRAFERFTSQGPFALLPLREKTMSLVWCVAEPSDLMAMSDETFLNALQQQFGWKLGKFQQVGKRFVYPLSLQKAERHTHHRLAIIGNAAQLIHPVAGQGFNLGMRDLFELAGLVGNAFKQGNDIGGFELLNRFEQLRSQDQANILGATSGLISLFCCESLPMQIFRNAGLIGLSHCRLARNQVAHRALGW